MQHHPANHTHPTSQQSVCWWYPCGLSQCNFTPQRHLIATAYRLEELESKRPSQFCLDEEGTSGDGCTFRADPSAGSSSSARQSAALDPDLAARLQRALEAFEQCSSSAATLAQQVRSHEQLVAATDAEDAIRMLAAQQASLASASSGRYSLDGTDADLASSLSADTAAGAAAEGLPGDQSTPTAEARSLRRDLQSEREHRLTLVAKLQRLELEKRTHVEEISELASVLTAARREADAMRAALADQDQQARQLHAAVEALQAELTVGGGQGAACAVCVHGTAAVPGTTGEAFCQGCIDPKRTWCVRLAVVAVSTWDRDPLLGQACQLVLHRAALPWLRGQMHM
jgi:hypothetical protein